MPPVKREVVPLTVRFEPALAELITRIADQYHVGKSTIVEWCCEAALTGVDNPLRLAAPQEASDERQ